jgi:hypothetical protein
MIEALAVIGFALVALAVWLGAMYRGLSGLQS